MGNEEEVTKKIGIYQDLAKDNPNINLASLMMNALEQEQREQVAQKKKRWAYLVSVGAPPLGLLFAIRYYFSDKADGKRIAIVCVVLTVISLLIAFAIGGAMFASVGSQDMNKIQSINAGDVKGLQDLIRP